MTSNTSGRRAATSISTGRRDLMRVGAAAAAALPLPAFVRAQQATRVVVVGGGWGGIALARKLSAAAGMSVTLVEPNAGFMSCPMSAHYVVGLMPAERLQMSYAALTAAGVTHVPEYAREIDRGRRIVRTDTRELAYDYLAIAPGIEYVEEGIDGFAAQRDQFPVGFRAFEHQALRKQLEAFTGGDIVVTAPPMPYRCPIAPYERAAMFADYMNRRGLKGKVILLDAKPQIPIGAPAILGAFEEMYKDRIEMHAGVELRGVDAGRRTLATSKGDIGFAMANVIPPMRAARIVREAGLGERWAPVVLPHFVSKADDRVYVFGDAAGTPLPKSGHLAFETGRSIADQIVARAAGKSLKEIEAPMPKAICFAFFSEQEAMGVTVGSKWDDFASELKRENRVDAKRSTRSAEAARVWSEGIWKALLG